MLFVKVQAINHKTNQFEPCTDTLILAIVHEIVLTDVHNKAGVRAIFKCTEAQKLINILVLGSHPVLGLKYYVL